MEIQNDEECEKLINKLGEGIAPEHVDSIISYLDKTNNQEFSLKLIKYLNHQNAYTKNHAWRVENTLAAISEEIVKIKKHLGIQ